MEGAYPMNHLETNRDGRTKIGAMILRKLGVLTDFVSVLETKHQVCRFEEPNGFGYYVNKEEQAVIDKMEEAGHTVYAVIKGRYLIGKSDIMDAATYLYIEDQDVENFNRNLDAGVDLLNGILDRYQKNQYYAMANIFGLEQEYGEVVIAPMKGGLTRTD